MREQGRCTSCGNPSGGASRCAPCRLRRVGLDAVPPPQAKRRGPRWFEHRIDWSAVDLRGNAYVIANELGVDVGTVYYQRHKRGIRGWVSPRKKHKPYAKRGHKKTPTPG